MKKYLTLPWIARGIMILYILFLALFALDVFEMNVQWYEKVLGFIVHLIPNFILIGLVWYTRNHEKSGGILFLALFFIFLFAFNNPFIINVIFFSPLLIVGGLFMYHAFVTNSSRKNFK